MPLGNGRATRRKAAARNLATKKAELSKESKEAMDKLKSDMAATFEKYTWGYISSRSSPLNVVTAKAGYEAFADSTSGLMKSAYRPMHEWLDEIEDEEFKEALQRAIIEQCLDPDEEFKTMRNVINRVSWDDTQEGTDYWDDYYCMAERGDKI